VTQADWPRTALCWGTVIGADFDGLLEAARSAGVPAIMVSPALYFRALAGGRTERDLRDSVDRSGVEVAVVDALVSPLPGLPDPASLPEPVRPVFTYSEDACLRMAEVLGAPIVNVAHVMGGAVPEAEMAQALAGIAGRAGERGLKVSIEFMPNSAAIPDLLAALRIAAASGVPNLGVMLDTWHVFRSGGEPADVQAAPAGAIYGVQVADAPADAKGRPPVPMQDRLLPGAGAIPIAKILAAVVQGSPDAVIGIEVISQEMAALPPADAARRAAGAMRPLLPRR
jgi:sugar phosphate isomerase/epimerase